MRCIRVYGSLLLWGFLSNSVLAASFPKKVATEILKQTSFSTLEQAKASPRAVTRLDLSGLGLRSLGFLKHFPYLVCLDLSDNDLEHGEEISSLHYLEALWLGKNRLRSLDFIRSLVRLEMVDVHDNELQCLPDSTHLSKMVAFDVSRNQISGDLSEVYTSLSFLDVRKNHIRQLKVEPFSQPDKLWRDKLGLASRWGKHYIAQNPVSLPIWERDQL